MVLRALSSPIVQLPTRRLLWSAPAAKASKEPAPKEPPKLCNLPTGEVVASWENYHPISRLSVAFKAGSRYESPYNLGVSHCLRNSAGFSTRAATIFAITRNLQLMGANMKCTNTRDLLIYTLECKRDKLKEAVKYFNAAINNQVFKPWEITDYLNRMKIDVAFYKQRPHVMVMEALHKAAFRTGLGNSLYSPDYMLGKHNTDMLTAFVNKHFAPNRKSVAGVGMSHDATVECAKMLTMECVQAGGEVPGATKYGGGEIRIDSDEPFAHVAVAANGVSLADPKQALAASIVQNILGTAPQVKRGMPPTKLMQAAAKATDNPFAVTALNLNYSDGGLFGFYVVGQAEDMGKILKNVIDEVSNVKCGVVDTAVKIAKERVRSLIHMTAEHSTDMAEELCSQALNGGTVYTYEEIDCLLDSITPADVSEIAKKITQGKPTMAAVGNLSKTPYLDQIK